MKFSMNVNEKCYPRRLQLRNAQAPNPTLKTSVFGSSLSAALRSRRENELKCKIGSVSVTTKGPELY